MVEDSADATGTAQTLERRVIDRYDDGLRLHRRRGIAVEQEIVRVAVDGRGEQCPPWREQDAQRCRTRELPALGVMPVPFPPQLVLWP